VATRRVNFLIPAKYGPLMGQWRTWIGRTPGARLLRHDMAKQEETSGGVLNIMRHCALLRSMGVDACLATDSGKDSYGECFGGIQLPFMKWGDRTPGDLCVVPDTLTDRIDAVEGPAVAYLQSPMWLRLNFDYRRPDVSLWTDSPFMLHRCRETFPDKEPLLVPNIIDPTSFPFIKQAERVEGLLLMFPRKGAEFIDAVLARYKAIGGTFWRAEAVDGLPFHELARKFRQPQAFLASAEVEGCALPPQECMAAGIVVVGRDARGANFCMRHRQTAMVANTPEEAADCLVELKDAALRQQLADRGHAFIRRYFPEASPSAFWREFLEREAASVFECQ